MEKEFQSEQFPKLEESYFFYESREDLRTKWTLVTAEHWDEQQTVEKVKNRTASLIFPIV